MNKPTLILSACIMLISAAACGGKGTATAATETAQPAEAAVAADDSVAQTASQSVIILESGMSEIPDGTKLTVIDFNATWCGPCKRFAPTFEAMAEEYSGKVNFVSVDVDKFPELAQKYGVQGIPHVAFITPGGQVDAAVGLDQLANFKDLIESHISTGAVSK